MSKSELDRGLPAGQGLRSRIVGLVVASTLVTALVLTGLSIHGSYARSVDRIDAVYPLLLRGSVQRVSTHLERSRDTIARLAKDPSLLPTPVDPERGPLPSGTHEPNLTRALRNALRSNPDVGNLIILDTAGEVRAVAGSGPALTALLSGLKPKRAVASGLLEALQSVEVRERLATTVAPALQVFERESAPPVPIASAPLRNATGRRVGSLHGLLSSASIGSALAGNDPVTAALFLVDGKGRVVTATSESDEPEVGAVRSLLPKDGETPTAERIFTSDGRWLVAAALPVGALGWTVMVQETVPEAFASLLVALPIVLLVGFALVTVFALFAGRVGSSISRPLIALSLGARRIAKGELDVELPSGDRNDEIGFLVDTFTRMTRRLRENQRELESTHLALRNQNEALQKQHQALERLSTTDGLTKLFNHRHFQDQLTREIKRLSRNPEGLCILIIDIDDFKKLNDTFGHAAGDEFLVQMARILKQSVRETDLLARYGGEEFVVVATGTDVEGATFLAEKLRTAVAEASFIVDGSMRPRRATVSIGVAQYEDDRKNFFKAADDALYRAKDAGKNCVVCAEINPDTGSKRS
jgi:diguanylate cyclase (GGDEF)-like protein